MQKVANKTGGNWYSTHDAGYCGADPSKEPAGCTWRVNEVVKRVNKTCSDNAIYATVEAHAPDCFGACTDSGTGE